MFQRIKSRLTFKKAAVLLTFALVITGSGLSSLASLSDVLNDSVEFSTLSVDLKDGTSDSSQIAFSGIDPSISGQSFIQTIDLTNSGSASATVSIASAVTLGGGTDLDTALTAAVFLDGVRLGGGVWPTIGNLGASLPTFALNAGASTEVTVQFLFTTPAVGQVAASHLLADIQFIATHP